MMTPTEAFFALASRFGEVALPTLGWTAAAAFVALWVTLCLRD